GASTVYRFNPDGTSDDGFGSHGVAALSSGADAAKVAIQADGKIVVGLVDFGPGGIPYQQSQLFGIARLNADGSTDSQFGSAGLVSVKGNLSNRSEAFFAAPPYEPIANLLIQPD